MFHGYAWLALLWTVTVSGTGFAQRYDVEAVPSVVLTGNSDSVPLVRPRSATRTARGFAVVDIKAPAILSYDRTGRFMRLIGRAGSGPGEYRSPAWIGSCGSDSLYVWDSSEHRISVFGPAGTFVRQFRSPVGGTSVRCTGERTFAMLMSPHGGNPPPSDGSAREAMAEVRILSFDGDSLASITGIAFADGRMFGRMAAISTRGSTIVVGTGEGSWVDLYDGRGKRERRVALALPVRSTDADAHARAVERMLDAIRVRGDRRTATRTMLLSLPIPPTFAPYRDLGVSPNGTLWLALGGPEDGVDVAELKAFDLRGNARGGTTLPRPLRLLEAGDDYLIAAQTSDNEEPVIGVYRVRSRPR